MGIGFVDNLEKNTKDTWAKEQSTTHSFYIGIGFVDNLEHGFLVGI